MATNDLNVLESIDRGFLRRDVDEAMRRVVEGVLETDKKGKVTIVLEIVPVNDSRVDVVSKLKAERPNRDGITTFYVDLDGELTRRDPNQPSLLDEEPGR